MTSGAKTEVPCPGLIFQSRRRPFLDVTAPLTDRGSIGDGENGGTGKNGLFFRPKSRD